MSAPNGERGQVTERADGPQFHFELVIRGDCEACDGWHPEGQCPDESAAGASSDDWTVCPFCSADHDFTPPCGAPCPSCGMHSRTRPAVRCADPYHGGDLAPNKEHDGCSYNAVLIEHEDGPWYFCNKCGWGEAVSSDG